MAASGLGGYQLGDLLGRGASGNVYRAINFLTGETVAIKSISVQSLPASQLPEIMSEIDLLKNLNHPNIVKYKGFTKDKDNLFIILEYCENGSLQTILKKFGKFPESLVAVYICQVLEGLYYLHEQGVIHRDIKGANILTNKDGSVKLADFGVSSRTPTPDIAGLAANTDAADNEVVGSPYWMAPEVIEQSGATSASDIWSVGCVVVELLEGKPPFGDLTPMQALWRIVQDESMRIPEGASPIVKDFLYQCFQKDPNLRVSAKKLLRHAWMQTARRNQGDTAGQTTPAKPKASTGTYKAGNNHTPRAGSITSVPTPRELASPRKEATLVLSKQQISQAEAIQRVQEWNEALNASPKNFSTMRRIAAPPPRRPETTRGRSDSLLAPVLSAAAAAPLPATGAGGLIQKNQHVSDVLNRARENSETEKWDDDFAFDVTIPKVPLRKPDSTVTAIPESDLEDDVDHETVRAKAVARSKPAATSSRLTGIVEDYSDLAISEDELETKLSNMKLRDKADKGRIRLMRPSDLQKISLQAPPPPPPKPTPILTLAPVLPPKASAMLAGAMPSPTLPTSSSSPTVATRTPPGSRNSSLRGRKAVSESNLELQKYTEADDEDYSDMFDEPIIKVDGGNTIGSLQLTRRSNRSWKEDDEEQEDPFAEFDDDFDLDDLEANLHHNKKASLWSAVEKIVDQMQVGTSMTTLKGVCDELLNMFESAPPDMGLERHFVQVHGMLTVLELLETRLNREVAMRLLKIVNFIVAFDVDNLESFCLVGGIPVIIPYTSKKHSLETRLEASTFIQHLTRSALTLQMFISCRGLKVLVELLDEDYSNQKTLILSALEGIGSVFDLQSPTPKPDFCRMFTREGILDPLATALLAVIKDPEVVDDTPKRAMDVLLLFCQVAQSDEHVRQGFATRTIMMRLLKTLDLLPDISLVTAIKAIKHLATHPKLIEVLQNSNAMEVLVNLLGKSFKGSYSNEICSHIFQAIYSMCRLSKARQEEAASAGIIPMLKRTIVNKSPLKQFALPILCDLANAGKAARRLLWQNDGMSIYLSLLDDPYWRTSALEAVVTWMADEPARVEDVLLEKESVDSLTKCFVQASNVSFERILDSYLKLFRLSAPVSFAIASTQFLRRLSESLERQAAAGVKLNLLRITRVVFENHPEREAMVARYSLDTTVDKLSKQDSAVLVRELAKEVYQSLVFGYQEPPPAPSGSQQQQAVPNATAVTASVLSLSTVPTKRVFSVRRASGDSGSSGGARSSSRIRVSSSLAPSSSNGNSGAPTSHLGPALPHHSHNLARSSSGAHMRERERERDRDRDVTHGSHPHAHHQLSHGTHSSMSSNLSSHSSTSINSNSNSNSHHHHGNSRSSQHSNSISMLAPADGESASSSRSVTPTPSKPKRVVSRQTLKDVSWAADENGRLKASRPLPLWQQQPREYGI